jgi:TldD protein
MAPLTDHEDHFEKALRRLEAFSSFAELMAERSSGGRLRFDSSAVSPGPAPRLGGVVLRAWDGQRWVEAAVASFEPTALAATAQQVIHRLPARTSATPPPGEAATGRAERVVDAKRPPSSETMEDRIALAKDWFGWATSVPGIHNAIISIFDTEDERLYLSTAGARRYQRLVRTGASVIPIALENGRVEYDYMAEGRLGGYEVLDLITEERVLEVARESQELLRAEAAPTGSMTVLMDPSTSGTFAHESFGHGTEADQLLRDRSYLKPLLGELLGPECLTLVDDGSWPDGWGTIFFDDEGHPAQRTVMVDRGRFVEVLHDRESAAAMGRTARGNTRRADFMGRPFVRMTNTMVEPSDWTFLELLEEAKEGILLQSCTSGIEDPLGGQMQIKVKKARSIENGQITKRYSSMGLSGRVLDVLRAIKGVSGREDFVMSPGSCGKGHSDILPVGTAGTYLLTEAVVGPA